MISVSKSDDNVTNNFCRKIDNTHSLFLLIAFIVPIVVYRQKLSVLTQFTSRIDIKRKTIWFVKQCLCDKWKVFTTFCAEFVIKDKSSAIEFNLQWLFTGHDIVISTWTRGGHLLDVHLSASCYNKLNSFPLEISLNVFCFDPFSSSSNHNRQNIFSNRTFHSYQTSVNLLDHRSNNCSLNLCKFVSHSTCCFPCFVFF